jgi:hypothetical protein
VCVFLFRVENRNTENKYSRTFSVLFGRSSSPIDFLGSIHYHLVVREKTILSETKLLQ